MPRMTDLAADLLRFIDASPTPYHAVAQAVRRLEGAGYSALAEADLWELAPGDRRHAVRGDASLVAFQVGALPPASGGFRIVGAHTDSPNLRVKPRPDRETSGYRQLAVEPYGALLVHTWLDRDLSLAGRVTLAGDGAHQTVLVDFERPLLRIPNLAIHLQREIAEQGLKLNAQQHLPPLVGLGELPPLRELVAAELRARLGRPVRAEQVLGFDLMAYDVQPAARAGARGEFLLAPRLDNLASCHAALSALLAVSGGAPAAATRMIVLYDHEEVGSRSAQGAAGTFLQEALERVVTGVKGGELQGLARAVRRSNLVSADMAHALHPNYADRHDPEHRPLLGGGPVIKVNANQSYASDAATAGLFTELCARVGVAPQHFVTRSDLACGSTIGPITAARVGVPTVDVGSPMLSMHSCREMAGADDVKPMIDVLAAFLAG
jgi:aspartyl aminopeptidase